MTRQYETRKSAQHSRSNKYDKALQKLRALQAECETPQNRYYCPCMSLADGQETATMMRDDFVRYKRHIYPDGVNNPPQPIDQRNVTPNEILFRMMMEDGLDESVLGSEDGPPTDGYRRWNPPAPAKGRANYDALTARINREISRLEERLRRGGGFDATACDVCIVKTPEHKIQLTGLAGATSYLCEMARAQTPEQIRDSNDGKDCHALWKISPQPNKAF